MVYSASCIACTKEGDRWSANTYRSGHDNDFLTCLSRWNEHWLRKHPDEPNPPSFAIEAEAVSHGYVYESIAAKKRRTFDEALNPNWSADDVRAVLGLDG